MVQFRGSSWQGDKGFPPPPPPWTSVYPDIHSTKALYIPMTALDEHRLTAWKSHNSCLRPWFSLNDTLNCFSILLSGCYTWLKTKPTFQLELLGCNNLCSFFRNLIHIHSCCICSAYTVNAAVFMTDTSSVERHEGASMLFTYRLRSPF